jgi:hypothetical protein
MTKIENIKGVTRERIKESLFEVTGFTNSWVEAIVPKLVTFLLNFSPSFKDKTDGGEETATIKSKQKQTA